MAAGPSHPRTIAGNYARGALMGVADVVPGVSGGTVALVLGIYERLVRSIRAAAGAPVALLRGDAAGARRCLREVEWSLVVPLVAGIGTAIVAAAVVIPGLLDRYPEGSRALFFGLIVASLPLPWRRIEHPVAVHVTVAVAAALVAFWLVGLPAREVVDPSLLYVAVCAAVAICAMILPGVSGAFLLLAFGVYEATLTAVSERDLAYIGVFGVGAIVGLGSFAKLLEGMLERYHDVTMAALVGLMVGALRALWPWLDAHRGLQAPPAEPAALGVLGLAVIGFVSVTAVVRFAARDASGVPEDRSRPKSTH